MFGPDISLLVYYLVYLCYLVYLYQCDSPSIARTVSDEYLATITVHLTMSVLRFICLYFKGRILIVAYILSLCVICSMFTNKDVK